MRRMLTIRPLLAAVALASVAATAPAAEWEQVNWRPELQWSIYIAPASVGTTNGGTWVKWLTSAEQPFVSTNVYSLVSYTEIDCETKRTRLRAWGTYSGKMATGRILESSSEVGPWLDRWQSAVDPHVIDAACSIAKSRSPKPSNR